MNDRLFTNALFSTEHTTTLLSLCVALGIGILIGAERERRKSTTPNRSAAGIRTFSVTALLGAIGVILGGMLMLAVVALIVGSGALLAYYRTRDEDPGLTTEFALLLTCFLGGMAVTDALLAAGIGVLLALLLASRNRIHHFVRSVVSEQELHDLILFSATALIILPLAPNRYLGPFEAINPYVLIRLVVIVMAISASGYVAMRWLGVRYGLPLAGFASGFVSSTATIHVMGTRAASDPNLMGAAVSGAVLSSFATIIQMSIVIALMKADLLTHMVLPLTLGGVTAGLYGLLYFVKGSREQGKSTKMEQGRAFDLKTAAGFAGLLALVLVVSGGLNVWLGNAGIILGATVSGLADAHAAAASVASLLAAGQIHHDQAIVPILLGLTANTFTKAVVAFNAGGKRYAMKIISGLVAMILSVWIGVWLTA